MSRKQTEKILRIEQKIKRLEQKRQRLKNASRERPKLFKLKIFRIFGFKIAISKHLNIPKTEREHVL